MKLVVSGLLGMTVIGAIIGALQLMAWFLNALLTSSPDMDKAGELMADAAIPSWVSVLQGLGSIANTTVGGFIIFGFVLWLVLSGQFRS
jgi:hypothetical protein